MTPITAVAATPTIATIGKLKPSDSSSSLLELSAKASGFVVLMKLKKTGSSLTMDSIEIS